MVQYRYSFIYSQYTTAAWFWEELELSRKFLLTSVIIYVKPRTTAQLAAASMITLAFLVLHVSNKAFKDARENTAQFYSQLSILLVLLCTSTYIVGIIQCL